MKLVIDASVWVAAFITADVHHAQADRLLEASLASRAAVVAPELVLLEVAAGVARIMRNEGQGQVAAKKVEHYPGIRFLSMDTSFMNKSILLATRHFLRGPDALYVTAARQSRATLVTLDEEMLHRGTAAVTVLTPTQWLNTLLS